MKEEFNSLVLPEKIDYFILVLPNEQIIQGSYRQVMKALVDYEYKDYEVRKQFKENG